MGADEGAVVRIRLTLIRHGSAVPPSP